jgi:hypothetical protein
MKTKFAIKKHRGLWLLSIANVFRHKPLSNHCHRKNIDIRLFSLYPNLMPVNTAIKRQFRVIMA